MSAPLRKTPLHDRHVAAGARLEPFAGYEMPILYTSILEETRAVRTRAGLFDVSHMGEISLRGPDAIAFAQGLFTRSLEGSENGRVLYGLLLAEDGGIIDDATLYRASDEAILLCVNASNIAEDLAWIRERQAASSLDCEVHDKSADTGLLAIQGPEARSIVDPLLPLREWLIGERARCREQEDADDR